MRAGAERDRIDEDAVGWPVEGQRRLVVQRHHHPGNAVIRGHLGNELDGLQYGHRYGREAEDGHRHWRAQGATGAHRSPGRVDFQLQLPDAPVQRHVDLQRHVILGAQQVGQVGVYLNQFRRRRGFAEEGVGVFGEPGQVTAVRAKAETNGVDGHAIDHRGPVSFIPAYSRTFEFVEMSAVAEQDHGAAWIVNGGGVGDGLQRRIIEQGLAAVDQAVNNCQQDVAPGGEILNEAASRRKGQDCNGVVVGHRIDEGRGSFLCLDDGRAGHAGADVDGQQDGNGHGFFVAEADDFRDAGVLRQITHHAEVFGDQVGQGLAEVVEGVDHHADARQGDRVDTRNLDARPQGLLGERGTDH